MVVLIVIEEGVDGIVLSASEIVLVRIQFDYT